MTNGEAAPQQAPYVTSTRTILTALFQSLFGIFIAIIFFWVFNSTVLGLLALAFLFYIPSVREEMGMFPNAIIFAAIMVFALMLAFEGPGVSGLGLDLGGKWYQPTEWNTSAIIFVGFWLIALLAGIFEIESRQVIGVFMIAIALFFFAVGPGTQDVGTAFFGQWWPSVYQFGERTITPVWEGLSSFFSTIQQGFSLLTNPVGYATQLMNGTHAANPQGQTGAHGLEFQSMDESPIYVETPFMITMAIQNKGVFDARNVEVSIKTNTDAPRTDSEVDLEPNLKELPSQLWDEIKKIWKGKRRKLLWVTNIGFSQAEGNCDRAWYQVEKDEVNPTCIRTVSDTIPVQSVEQVVFSSDGIPCRTVADYSLRKKAIPFDLSVSYDYAVNSSVEVEFISNDEYDRLAREGLLDTRLRTIESQYSTAPVIFPIGTAGLKNPIKAGQTFHIGMRLEPDGKGGRIEEIEQIVLNLPSDFELAGDCRPEGAKGEVREGTYAVTWKAGEQSIPVTSAILYCPLKLKDGSLGGGPSKTYLVTAYATYRFTRTRKMTSIVEFGGKCCSEDDCLGGQVCCEQKDIEKGFTGGYCTAAGSCEGTVISATALGGEDYCKDKIAKTVVKCVHGEGDCDELPIDECDTSLSDPNFGKLDCRSISGKPDLCCFENEPDADCILEFENRRKAVFGAI